METDSFFWQVLKQLPETLFVLLSLPIKLAAAYRFDAPEIKKKSYRLDGLFVPTQPNLPLYFVEVQFQRNHCFYANLFAKVFSYLEANDPDQEWVAVALFANRAMEPKEQSPYRELLASPRVRRIYLDEVTVPASAASGLAMLQLVTASKSDAPELVAELLKRARRETDCEKSHVIIELVEELLLRKFTELDREGVLRMFKLEDIRKSRVWQEAQEEAKTEEQQRIVRLFISNGKEVKEIAKMLKIPVAKVRRLAQQGDA